MISFYNYYFFGATKKKYWYYLNGVEKEKRDRRILQLSLRMYKSSPFHYLYDSGDNQVLFNCTGFDHETFNNLLNKSGAKFDNYTFDEQYGIIRPKRRSLLGIKGRPRGVGVIGGLGLVPMWYRTRGHAQELQP